MLIGVTAILDSYSILTYYIYKVYKLYVLRVLATVLGKCGTAYLIKPYKAKERKRSPIWFTSLYIR